jgi:hypothetical protein
VLNIMESPLGSKQLDLFGAIVAAEPPKTDPAKLGEQAGREAVDAGANPFTPGSEDFVAWADGWAKGQMTNADNFAKQ